ncbi:hypothetical protein PHMEG_00030911 [Phytophthora megakarya]|uniref:Uncharacterized protein n=1 Tax=Phytophthora megakarya TaxID=4795 RepID=A0A225UZG5_9STRA|nr:hypothetical protein PHMEG_00030911 [Phytophthora megakarya]
MIVKREDCRGPWICDFRCALLEAAGHGHLEVVQWLHDHATRYFDCQALNDAALNRYLAVVEWLHTHNYRNATSGNPMDEAAANGHLEVVQWLHEHQRYYGPCAMNRAAEGGHLEIVQWLQNKSSEIFYTSTVERAAMNGHLNTIEWMYSHAGCDVLTDKVFFEAAYNGHLEVVKWAYAHRQHGHHLKSSRPPFMDGLAGCGRLGIIKWMRTVGVPGCFTKEAMDTAASNGHLEMVQWLHTTEKANCTKTIVNIILQITLTIR